MKTAIIILAILCIIATHSPALAETATIRNDGGGNVSRYIETRARLAKLDSVRIEGKCLSACTIFTTLPNTCVAASAKIGFHGTSPRVPFMQRALDMRLGRYYRGEVQRLYLAEWRRLRGSSQFHIITGAQLHKLDPLVRLCR